MRRPIGAFRDESRTQHVPVTGLGTVSLPDNGYGGSERFVAALALEHQMLDWRWCVAYARSPVLKIGTPISVRHAELSGVSVSATM